MARVDRRYLLKLFRACIDREYYEVALALLCHEYIWFHRPDLRRRLWGYGFGCPRVIYGHAPQERLRWRNFYVIRNIDDVITHLPPSFLGFRHVGNMVEIGRAKKYSPIDAHRAENYMIELGDTEN